MPTFMSSFLFPSLRRGFYILSQLINCWFAGQWLLFCLIFIAMESTLKLNGNWPCWKQNYNSFFLYDTHAGDSGYSICFPTTGYEVLHHNRTSYWLYGWALSGKHFYFYGLNAQMLTVILENLYTMWEA